MAAIRSVACMEKEYTVLCGAMTDEFRITFFFGPEAAPDRPGVVRCVFNVKKRSWKGGVQVTVELAAAQLERIRDRGQFGELIEMIRAKVEPEMFAEYELRARDLFRQQVCWAKLDLAIRAGRTGPHHRPPRGAARPGGGRGLLPDHAAEGSRPGARPRRAERTVPRDGRRAPHLRGSDLRPGGLPVWAHADAGRRTRARGYAPRAGPGRAHQRRCLERAEQGQHAGDRPPRPRTPRRVPPASCRPRFVPLRQGGGLGAGAAEGGLSPCAQRARDGGVGFQQSGGVLELDEARP